MKEVAFPILFADDTSFLISNPHSVNLNLELETALKKAHNWFKANIMLLNYDKTSFLQFLSNSYSRSLPPVNLNSCFINETYSIKFLGIRVLLNLETTHWLYKF